MSGQSIAADTRRPWRTWAAAFTILASLSVLWSLATPVFASPDENAHATKAVAQVRGVIIAEARDGVDLPVVPLPDEYRFDPSMMCFAFAPERSADCPSELGVETGTDWFGNWVTLYNPLYYWIVGWPSLLLGGSAGVYAMRIVSALLCAAVLALAAPVALRSGARWAAFGFAFVASPMVVFMAGSVNPQGLEIAGAVVSWIAMLRLFERYHSGGSIVGDRWLVVAVVVGAVALAHARALGPLWWLVIVIVAGLVVGWRSVLAFFADRRAWPMVAAVALVMVAAIGWTALAGTLATQAQPDDGVAGIELGPLEGIWAVLRSTPVYLEQAIGVFGWLDTFLPALVLSLYVAAASLLVTMSATSTGRRGAVTVAGLAATAILLPALVQGLTIGRTGLIWQGRYSLWIYLGLVLVAAWALDRWGRDAIGFLAPRFTAVGAGLLGLFHIAAYAIVLHRYVVGSAATVESMISDPHWQPPLGWATLLALLVLVVAAWTVWILSIARRPGQAIG